MRIQDLCAAMATPPPTQLARLAAAQDPRPLSSQPSPTRLPALSALFPSPLKTTEQLEAKSLNVTIRIPTRTRPPVTADRRHVAVSPNAVTPLSTAPIENGHHVSRGESPRINSDDTGRQHVKRKRSDDAREQESTQLHDELRHLEAQLTRLKRKTHQGQDASSNPASPVLPPVEDMDQLRREMQLYVASLGCMLLQRAPDDIAAPVHPYIHLGCSMEARRRTILQIRPEQLRLGRQLVEQRSKFLDPAHPHASHEWFTTEENDLCGLHFFVEQIRGPHSVEQAFSAAHAFISNYKVTAKKTVSVLKYHDDNEVGNQSANIQLRVLMKTPDGPVIESNTLLFSQYEDKENVGIIVANYVDRDDLRPHDPTKRFVQEASAVFLLSPPLNGEGVVLRHWVFIRSRHAPHLMSDLDFGPFARENQIHTGGELVQYVRNELLARPP